MSESNSKTNSASYKIKKRTIKAAAEQLLKAIFGGTILNSANFKETPERMANMYLSMIDSQEEIIDNAVRIVKKTFPSSYKGMILLPEIKTISFCPHHMLPVEYTIHIAYIPNEKTGTVIGASKPERLSKALSKYAVLQESYTNNIMNAIKENVKPAGVAIVVQGKHSCMRVRGIKNPCASMITSSMWGSFKDNIETRNEFFKLLELRG